ncbi:MAG: WD40 repeat domain-containing protein, partial [Dolichospermum sp.]
DNDQETAETLELTPPKSLIDEKTGKLVFFNNLKTHKNKVFSVAFSPNGKLLASGSDDKIIMLWDLATKKHSILLETWEGLVLVFLLFLDNCLLVVNLIHFLSVTV